MRNKHSYNVKIGHWYSQCCILDLYEIKTAEDLEYVVELMDDEDDNWNMNSWETLEDAVNEMINEWGENLDDRPDLKLLLNKEI